MSKKLIPLLLAAAFAASSAAAMPTSPRKTLTAFASEQELADLFKTWAAEGRRRDLQRNEVAKAAAAPASVAGALAAAEPVTNAQHAGVDEGGIVKLHGDHLVILRRARLFTVDIRDRQLQPVSSLDAFGGEVDPRGAWYDEMLISGNTIAVIGYSYARGGTEIGLFEISRAGQLSYKATYHLRSNDYYSSRNYASRLIGSKLVFYTPLYLDPWSGDPYAAFPAMRRWRSGATPAEFKRIAPATRIYRSDEPLDPWQGVALHSVSICELARPELACESTAVLGPRGRVFYVSANSVFVWNVKSGVFRIPLDGSAPSALKAAGSPIDQFSFLEGEDGFLNVLLRAHGSGEAMWSSERRAGDLALLRAPLSSFSDGRDSAPPESYKALPRPGSGHALQNRFIGSYLLYGAGAGWRRPRSSLESNVYAVRYADGGSAYELPLPHGVDRIEALGRHAVVVGSDGKDLHFTSLRLNRTPVATDRYTRANASQGETRSHGFFYKADNQYEGMVGLPIIGGGQPASHHLRRESASLLYLRNEALSLRELGTLDSRPAGANDGCRASCVDWYGNSRPIFVRGRVFALMGYEIVEGRLLADRIAEIQRISFAPQSIEISR